MHLPGAEKLSADEPKLVQVQLGSLASASSGLLLDSDLNPSLPGEIESGSHGRLGFKLGTFDSRAVSSPLPDPSIVGIWLGRGRDWPRGSHPERMPRAAAGAGKSSPGPAECSPSDALVLVTRLHS